MNKSQISILIIFLQSLTLLSQEFRGGDIWCERTTQNKYTIHYDIYYHSENTFDQPYLLITHSGASSDTAFLEEQIELENDLILMKYTSNAVYVQNSMHYVGVWLPIVLPQLENHESNLDFYFLTSLHVPNPVFGLFNSPPYFTNLHTEQFISDGTWWHDAKGYDPDGDGLTYEYYNLSDSTSSLIIDHETPNSSEYFLVDSLTGLVTWEKPVAAGKYLIGIQMIERFGTSTTILNRVERIMIVEIKVEDIVTNISNFENVTNFEIFPNPIQNILKLKFKNESSLTNYTISISNIIGQILYQESLDKIMTSSIKEIDVSGFSQGTYFLTLRNNEEVLTRKFVIQK